MSSDFIKLTKKQGRGKITCTATLVLVSVIHSVVPDSS